MIRCRVNGGLSVISAFATGIGSAVAVDLPMHSEVSQSANEYSGNRVVRKILEFTDGEFGSGTRYDISISSSIPPSRGLKSSSTTVLAVIRPVLELCGIKVDDATLLNSAAKASMFAGISATGALDDLAASFYGGISLCNNASGRIISVHTVDESRVAIAYSRKQRPSVSMGDRGWETLKESFSTLPAMVMNGKYREAMQINGELMSRITGLDSETLEFLKSTVSGTVFQSGKGPAMASFVDGPITVRTPVPEGLGLISTRLTNSGLEMRES